MLSGVTYDAKGELTNDTFNSYTWDVEGHPATITPSGRGSQTYTYDAMGRLAELFNGVQYLEVIYSPSGVKLGTMRSKSSIWRLYLPLPGGGQAVYFQSTSTPAYYRRGDWLHSARIASTPSRTVPFDTDVPPFSAR
jgi:YD repeat-containing protein